MTNSLLTLPSAAVQLRSPVYKSAMIECTAGCSAGDFILPHDVARVVAVACEDIAAGQLGSMIYAADKIVVPCDFGSNQKAGAVVSWHNGKAVELGAGTYICGILNVAATTSSTECEITLLGFILDESGGS